MPVGDPKPSTLNRVCSWAIMKEVPGSVDLLAVLVGDYLTPNP